MTSSTARSSTPRSWVAEHDVVAYVGLAYGFSWAIWTPMVLEEHGLGSVPWSSHVPGLMGPMLAAVVVTGFVDGRVGLDRVVRSCCRRPPARWLVMALSPLAFLAIAVAVTAPVTGLARWSDFADFDGLPSSVGPVGVLVLLVVVNGFGEETGWRGFLQPTLQRGVPVRRATLTVAAIWGLWHAPLFLLDSGLGEMSPAMIPVWAGALTAGAVVLAWLHNHTSSVLAVAIWHGTYNWATATGAADAGVAALVTGGVIAVALVVVRRDPTLGAASFAVVASSRTRSGRPAAGQRGSDGVATS